MNKEININAKPIMIKKRIGSTTYEVNAYFNAEAKETASEKILRIIKNDLKLSAKSGILKLPQTGLIVERSSA